MMDEGEPFSEFVAGQEDEVEITWTNGAPDYGKACLIKQCVPAGGRNTPVDGRVGPGGL